MTELSVTVEQQEFIRSTVIAGCTSTLLLLNTNINNCREFRVPESGQVLAAARFFFLSIFIINNNG